MRKLDDIEKEMHDGYRHYRGSAVAFSATAIGILGGAILQLSSAPLDLATLRIFVVSITTLLIGALAIQFLHYQGYKLQARASYERWLGQVIKDGIERHKGLPPDEQDPQTLRELDKLVAISEKKFIGCSQKHTKWFTALDGFMWVYPPLLAVGLIGFAVFLWYNPSIITSQV